MTTSIVDFRDVQSVRAWLAIDPARHTSMMRGLYRIWPQFRDTMRAAAEAHKRDAAWAADYAQAEEPARFEPVKLPPALVLPRDMAESIQRERAQSTTPPPGVDRNGYPLRDTEATRGRELRIMLRVFSGLGLDFVQTEYGCAHDGTIHDFGGAAVGIAELKTRTKKKPPTRRRAWDDYFLPPPKWDHLLSFVRSGKGRAWAVWWLDDEEGIEEEEYGFLFEFRRDTEPDRRGRCGNEKRAATGEPDQSWDDCPFVLTKRCLVVGNLERAALDNPP